MRKATLVRMNRRLAEAEARQARMAGEVRMLVREVKALVAARCADADKTLRAIQKPQLRRAA